MAKSTASTQSALEAAAAAGSAAPVPPPLAPLPATYEAALKELEALASGLDSGQLPLDQLLGAYQRGAQLLAFCKSRLEAVEEQIKVFDGNGLKPWSPG